MPSWSLACPLDTWHFGLHPALCSVQALVLILHTEQHKMMVLLTITSPGRSHVGCIELFWSYMWVVRVHNRTVERVFRTEVLGAACSCLFWSWVEQPVVGDDSFGMGLIWGVLFSFLSHSPLRDFVLILKENGLQITVAASC